MSRIINLTYSAINIYHPSDLVGLTRVSDIQWLALGTEGRPIMSFPSEGALKINTTMNLEDPFILENETGQVVIPVYQVTLLEVEGLPDDISPEDSLIVMQQTKIKAINSGYPLASQMVCPTYPVLYRETGGLIGYMGLEL
jgi:hypothetical protein